MITRGVDSDAGEKIRNFDYFNAFSNKFFSSLSHSEDAMALSASSYLRHWIVFSITEKLLRLQL